MFFLQTSIPLPISILYAKDGVSRLSVENFLPHSAEKFRGGTLQCFKKFRVSKNFMLQRVMSRFSVEFLLYRKTLQANPSVLCFRKFSVAKKFVDNRGGEYQNFPSKNFRLKVPKNFVEEPFCISQNF